MNKEEINKVIVNDKKGFSQALLYRLLPSLLVFILALLSFNNGVYLEDKPNICTDPLFVQIYYIIGLFLLAGIDFGMPVGGNDFYRILLYISYFLAPLITVLAVIESVLKTIGADYLKRPYKNHVVIIGASKEAISIIHSWNAPENMPYVGVGFDRKWSNLLCNNKLYRTIYIKYFKGGFRDFGYCQDTKLIVVEKDPNNTKLEYFRDSTNHWYSLNIVHPGMNFEILITYL